MGFASLSPPYKSVRRRAKVLDQGGEYPALTTKTKTYRLLGADGCSHQSARKGLFGGNRRMKIYGRLDCPSALRAIKRGPTYARYRVFFADEASAIAAGFRPCGVCMRAAYEKWKAAKQKNNLRHDQTPNNPPTNRTKKAKEIPGQKS